MNAEVQLQKEGPPAPPPCVFVSAEDFLASNRWDALPFLNPFKVPKSWKRLSDICTLRSGELRPSGSQIYRPGDLPEDLAFDVGLLDPLEGKVPKNAVRTDDVLMTRFLPMKAVYIGASAPLREPDSNLLRLSPGTELRKGLGLWLAALLNSKFYQKRLAALATGATMPRVGAKDLRDLPVPLPPLGAEDWPAAWDELDQRALSLRSSIMTLLSDLDDQLGTEILQRFEGSWGRYFEAAACSDSWLPDHVALEAGRIQLRKRDYEALSPFVVESGRIRGDKTIEGRLLRIGDADELFGYRPPPIERLSGTLLMRILEQPGKEGDILLSLLGTAPKIIWLRKSPKDTLWLSDHWVKLRTPRFPGALAARLMLGLVELQLSASTFGIRQQYVRREDIERILIPALTADEARRVHQTLLDLLEERDEIEEERAKLRQDITGAVADALKEAQ